MNTILKAQVQEFPTQPGVYTMRDDGGAILYVGKAKNLRSRIRSYFTGDRDPKTAVLIAKVAEISVVVTNNEYEALLLENALIKEHNPRYNINLKDGKSYPVIRITADTYPRVFKTRRIVRDGSEYFGPFPNVAHVDAYLELIDRFFPLRKCRAPQLQPRQKPCLYHHIGRCSAPCAGKIDRETYAARVNDVRALLSGKTEAFIEQVRAQMVEASQAQEYERARLLRDTIRAIEDLSYEQRIVDFDPQLRDYIGYAAGDGLCSFVVFQMRAGHMINSTAYHAATFGTDAENVGEFIVQFYAAGAVPPASVYISAHVADRAGVQRYFTEQLGARVEICPPRTTRDAAVLRLATENARQELEKRLRERGDLPALEELQRVLGLPHPPLRIEGFDIAQVGGKNTVAALVSFLNGVPDPSAYRRYRIRSVRPGQVDDFAAMREVIARRFTRVKNERLPVPDLILIDGGAGQVGAAVAILEALELRAIPVVGLAKRNEELYLPNQADPIRLPEGSAPLRVLQHVRDEAHRFATTYRAGLQKRDVVTSVIERVPGVGPKRAARLLRSFESVEALLATPVDIVARTMGANERLAALLQEQVRRELYGGE